LHLQDYLAIAKIIKNNTKVDLSNGLKPTNYVIKDLLVSDFVTYLKSDNKSFKEEKFIEECGLIKE
jgi:hypothetical protein